MKQQPRTKHTLQTDSDRLPNKFFEGQKTNPTMMSYDAAKHTIDFSDSIPSSHKVNMPPHFMNFLKNSASNQTKLSKNDKAYRTETGAPETESSIQYESKRMSYPLKADPNISFTKPQIKKRTSSKGSNLNRSLVQESSKTHDKHERSISPVLKHLDLPRNNMCFQTYDPENMPTKKRPTSIKPSRKEAPAPVPVKAQAQFKRKANSALRGSKVQNSIDFSKMIHQPLYEELYESLKPNQPIAKHMRKKSSLDVPPSSKPQPRRSSSISGNIKPGKKRNSQPNIGEYNNFTTEGTISHAEGPYHLDNYLNVATTVDKRIPDPQDLTEKEMYEMHANLSSYYDLLVQRDEANSRLLQNLKGNFHSLMGEFMKNYQIIRQYNGFKEQYAIEREKSQKEKDLLKLQLDMLKNENSKLKNLNLKYIQSDVNQSFSHQPQSQSQNPFLVSQDIQHTIHEERKLMELLDQREKFISFMKEKENKYIALLNAIEAKGINVDKIYEQDVGKVKQTENENTFATGESISEIVLTNMDDNYIRIAKPLKTLPTESSQGEAGQDLFNFAKRMQGLKKIQKKGSSNKQSRVEYHNWAERQITEASLSKTESPYSQSLFSSYHHHPVKQEKSLNKLIDDFPIKPLMQRKKTVNNSFANIQEGGNEEVSFDIKDRLKLDLSTLQQKVIKQYHDEFMEKWAEFTSSWKRAMKNDKTFQEVLNE